MRSPGGRRHIVLPAHSRSEKVVKTSAHDAACTRVISEASTRKRGGVTTFEVHSRAMHGHGEWQHYRSHHPSAGRCADRTWTAVALTYVSFCEKRIDITGRPAPSSPPAISATISPCMLNCVHLSELLLKRARANWFPYKAMCGIAYCRKLRTAS